MDGKRKSGKEWRYLTYEERKRSTLKGTRKGSPLLKSLSVLCDLHEANLAPCRDDAHFALCVPVGMGSRRADSMRSYRPDGQEKNGMDGKRKDGKEWRYLMRAKRRVYLMYKDGREVERMRGEVLLFVKENLGYIKL